MLNLSVYCWSQTLKGWSGIEEKKTCVVQKQHNFSNNSYIAVIFSRKNVDTTSYFTQVIFGLKRPRWWMSRSWPEFMIALWWKILSKTRLDCNCSFRFTSIIKGHTNHKPDVCICMFLGLFLITLDLALPSHLLL